MRTWFLSPSCIGPIQVHAGYLHGQSHRPHCAGAVQVQRQTQARAQHCSHCDSRLVCWSARYILVVWLLPHPALSALVHRRSVRWLINRLTPTHCHSRRAQIMKAARRPRSPTQLEAYACCVRISRCPAARTMTMNASTNWVIKFMSLSERTACKRQLKIFFVTFYCAHIFSFERLYVHILLCSVLKCVCMCFCAHM